MGWLPNGVQIEGVKESSGTPYNINPAKARGTGEDQTRRNHEEL